MAKYKVVTVYFASDNARRGITEAMWDKYHQGFIRSATENLVDAEVVVVRPDPPAERRGCKYSYTANNLKLQLWNEQVQLSDIPVVLIDIDTIILKDLKSIFDYDFDIAVTERPGKAWFNGGVVCVKPTVAAKEMMNLWAKYDSMLYADEVKDRVPKRLRAIQEATKHDGMNQPSFVRLLDQGVFPGKVIKVPAKVWNNCDQTWREFYGKAKVVHVKGDLRDAMKTGFRMIGIHWQLQPMVRKIKRYYS